MLLHNAENAPGFLTSFTPRFNYYFPSKPFIYNECNSIFSIDEAGGQGYCLASKFTMAFCSCASLSST